MTRWQCCSSHLGNRTDAGRAAALLTDHRRRDRRALVHRCSHEGCRPVNRDRSAHHHRACTAAADPLARGHDHRHGGANPCSWVSSGRVRGGARGGAFGDAHGGWVRRVRRRGRLGRSRHGAAKQRMIRGSAAGDGPGHGGRQGASATGGGHWHPHWRKAPTRGARGHRLWLRLMALNAYAAPTAAATATTAAAAAAAAASARKYRLCRRRGRALGTGALGRLVGRPGAGIRADRLAWLTRELAKHGEGQTRSA